MLRLSAGGYAAGDERIWRRGCVDHNQHAATASRVFRTNLDTCGASGDARPKRRNKMLGSSKNRSNSQTGPPVLNSTAIINHESQLDEKQPTLAPCHEERPKGQSAISKQPGVCAA